LFPAHDARADGRTRVVELSRERVVVRRAVAGISMAVARPLKDFIGVSIRILPPAVGEHEDGAVAVVLEHHDAALRVPLFVAVDGQDIVAEWRNWGRVLSLPLVMPDHHGDLTRFPAVVSRDPQPRRKRRNRARPAMLLRRKPGRMPAQPTVHRGEREIIARN
jgi:hypothetical protein